MPRYIVPFKHESQEAFADREIDLIEEMTAEGIASPFPFPRFRTLRGLWAWVRRNVAYQAQPYVVYGAWETIRRGKADCKSYAVLIGVLAERSGFEVLGLCQAGLDGDCNAHVYVEVADRSGDAVAVDAMAPYAQVQGYGAGYCEQGCKAVRYE